MAGYQAKLASLEAAIYAIAPDLKLPLQHRKANPVFPRGDFSRTMLEVLRDAPEPLPMRAIAIRMLALRGVDMPDKIILKSLVFALVGACNPASFVSKIGLAKRLFVARESVKNSHDHVSGVLPDL